MGMTIFSDLTSQEFLAKMSDKSPINLREAESVPESMMASPLGQTPNIDCRSTLQQQEINTDSRCNSNYAWIAAVNMNANYYIKQGTMIRYHFSPQTYIDCSANFFNNGCNGGQPFNSFNYSAIYGIDMMHTYPYFGYQRPCRATKGEYRNQAAYKVMTQSNSELFKILSRDRQIVSVQIDLTSQEARFYTNGVFTGPCGTNVSQHLILFGAGQDNQSGMKYWNVMNTWGSIWGERGMMRIARFEVDRDPRYSSCGLNMFPSMPIF